MREKILELEKLARQLEPSPQQRADAQKKVLGYTEDFLNRIETSPVYNTTSDKGVGILNSPISDEPIPLDQAISLIRDFVDYPGLNPASGGHLGYIPGGGIYYASLGDYLADVTNRFAGVFFAGPGAVRMENMLIRWLAGVVGYPENAAGNLTSGGSIANLIGVVTARDAMNIQARDVERSVIYLTQQVHHSVDKAIRIAGLKEAIVRYIPLDDRYRMIAARLDEQIRADRQQNLNPFLVIASAGTTDVGAIDPLTDIGTIAKNHGLWYHVDAAYGGFFALTQEGKAKLHGMELSDSLVIDPHKGLFLPYGLGVALVKDQSKLHASHYYVANYMQDALAANEEPSPAELSPELTKHFRGMRMWLPLKLHGLRPFRACLEEKLLLAKYFYREVQKLGFETGPEPELSVVTYRYNPKSGDPNAFNKRVLDEVVKAGRVFISSTMLDGKFTLRFACLAFRTHLQTVDLLLQTLKKKVALLKGEGE
ncbi:MAG TPA: aminotransferase class V-fold PLP-dependent enzyme [Acidobacteriota bacterium]|nr:aminotransferase class V-fold PLP-dependent enzyme [Acidobacteriota bacterium]